MVILWKDQLVGHVTIFVGEVYGTLENVICLRLNFHYKNGFTVHFQNGSHRQWNLFDTCIFIIFKVQKYNGNIDQ